jgi:predicted GIY-YIG superfamily endonuclease
MTRTTMQLQGDRCMRMNQRRFDDTGIYIYAYVDSADRVVYVGRTWDPPTRHAAHRKRSRWWSPSLTFAVIDIVLGWPTAVEVEAQAIRELRPLVNIQHNRRVA